MDTKQQGKLAIVQMVIWMASLVAVIIAITVIENVYEVFPYGPVCLATAMITMVFAGLANGHLQSQLKRTRDSQATEGKTS